MSNKKVTNPQYHMHESSALLVAIVSVLMVGSVIWYLTPKSMESLGQEDHLHTPGTPQDHAHDTYEWDGVGTPVLRLSIDEDQMSGYNLSFRASNFLFTPESVNQDHIKATGHAHLYVDGVKITRLYGEHYYMDNLSKGQHQIKVVLNTNNHLTYTIDGKPLETVRTILVK